MLESPTIAANAKNGTMAKFGDDTNLYVEFEKIPHLNQFKTDELGYPYYDDIEVIKIMSPGNNKSNFIDKINPSYIKRFPREYEAYTSQNEVVHDGLPLTEWPVLTKAQALNLKSSKIFTVEQLAALPDQNIDVLGLGGSELRAKAKTYLARAVDGSEITKLYAKMAALEADNAAMKEMLSQPLEQPKSKKG